MSTDTDSAPTAGNRVVVPLAQVRDGDLFEGAFLDQVGGEHPFSGPVRAEAGGYLAVGPVIIGNRAGIPKPIRGTFTRDVPRLPTGAGHVFKATVDGMRRRNVYSTGLVHGEPRYVVVGRDGSLNPVGVQSIDPLSVVIPEVTWPEEKP